MKLDMQMLFFGAYHGYSRDVLMASFPVMQEPFSIHPVNYFASEVQISRFGRGSPPTLF